MSALTKTLFWDTDLTTLDEEAHAPFIIRRVLGRGDMHDVKWILRRYGRTRVASVAQAASDLDERSRNFWTHFFASQNSQQYASRNA